MPFPDINPIALHIGPFAIHWYGIAYVVGILGWWKYSLWLTKKFPPLTPKLIDDYLVWAVIGVVVGGRLGYVFFYNPSKYLANPLEIFQVWKGGMAFHGGILGVICATALYTKRHKLHFLTFSDLACCGVPLGLFFGRLANFINGELFGRLTTTSWGVVFPQGGPLARHPSQLYEAFLEGICLFIVLFLGATQTLWPQRSGLLTGVFLSGYGIARFIAECFREPDVFLGYIVGNLTMGQILSLPMIGIGFILVTKALMHHEKPCH